METSLFNITNYQFSNFISYSLLAIFGTAEVALLSETLSSVGLQNSVFFKYAYLTGLSFSAFFAGSSSSALFSNFPYRNKICVLALSYFNVIFKLMIPESLSLFLTSSFRSGKPTVHLYSNM